MIAILLRRNFVPVQVDDFGPGVERSCQGSLHLFPGTFHLTDSEWEHIKRCHKEIASEALELLKVDVETIGADVTKLSVTEEKPEVAPEEKPSYEPRSRKKRE